MGAFWGEMYKPLLLMLMVGLILLFITVAFASEPVLPDGIELAAESGLDPEQGDELEAQVEAEEQEEPKQVRERVPETVRGIYLSGYVAGDHAKREALFQLVEETELNTVVIDYKDSTGKISYMSEVPLAGQINAGERKIGDLPELLERLEERGIYTIARIVVFQDPIFAAAKPELALRNRRTGGLWRDRKGLAWADPYSQTVWDYNISLAQEAAELGFREIQWDYVRFPSDGAIKDIEYPLADDRTKSEVITAFLTYAREKLEPYPVYISADIFGLITSVDNDQGIGQYFEDVAGAVDYISPMVYPSHYALRTFGLPDPNKAPYETVYRAIEDGQERLREGDGILRPWLQDFSLGYTYGSEEVMAQIKALEDLGINQWLLWNPANKYTAAALRPAE
ncbi:MAG: putative glycoside hydrolase [bacterium]|jgi:hypothetical protein